MYEKKNTYGEIIFLAIIGLFSAYLLSGTKNFAVSIMDKSGGAALFPNIILWFLISLVVIRILLILTIAENRGKDFVFLEMFQGSRLFLLAAIFIYAILVGFLGYLLSTMFFLIGSVNYFYCRAMDTVGSRSLIIKRNVILVLLSIFLYLFFTKVLGAVLPVNILVGGF